ncbi:RNA pseudouridine synthase 7-like [Herrania umbratica]|uniref:RNA pseudouridine synthase 7-like n=1 Tax=Herrania umbratica TaxID=108875 RepID=A0A6J1AJF6_9ROSI|nr:RNA pseudouridine synthase 7-like [Herrania umbratica]
MSVYGCRGCFNNMLIHWMMRVHPFGQHRNNTVLGILQAEHGLASLYPIHRLDRLVSGMLVVAKNPAKADIFRQHIEAGLVQKQCVAKVIGVFPEGEVYNIV